MTEENAPQYEGIAVLGSHPHTVNQAPFDDPKWLIYACSPHNLCCAYNEEQAKFSFDGAIPQEGQHEGRRFLDGGKRPDGGKYRVDEWFEVHVPVAHQTRPLHYLKEVEKLPTVWVRDADAMTFWKGARWYPEKEITERFGYFFWTSSIAYILAKAILDCEEMGIKNLGIFGVMQASKGEYEYQRPGVQYWIQRATELGITVQCPEESKLFEPQNVEF